MRLTRLGTRFGPDLRTRVRIWAAAALAASVLFANPASVAASPVAGHVPEIPRVGALFFPSGLGLTELLGLPHNCSGSVLDSPSRNLVLTAAHCIYGNGLGYQFAPGYHDGQFPFGLWTVRHVYVDPEWLHGQDPHHDYAVLDLDLLRGRHIADVVGGYPIGAAPVPGTTVTVDGYLRGARDEPLTCMTQTYDTAGFPSIDCGGFGDGTSGGPWLAHGQLVGAIGGLHQGGCTADTSYSAPFGPEVAALIARADSGARADTVLALPGGSSCG